MGETGGYHVGSELELGFGDVYSDGFEPGKIYFCNTVEWCLTPQEFKPRTPQYCQNVKKKHPDCGVAVPSQLGDPTIFLGRQRPQDATSVFASVGHSQKAKEMGLWMGRGPQPCVLLDLYPSTVCICPSIYSRSRVCLSLRNVMAWNVMECNVMLPWVN